MINALFDENAGLARIRSTRSDAKVGMGVLLSSRYVLTCAHVVTEALNVDAQQVKELVGTVRVPVEFPFATKSTTSEPAPIAGTLVRWSSPDDGYDLALLELYQDAPAGVGVACLASIVGSEMQDDQLSVFGFPKGNPNGRRVLANFQGNAAGQLTQITGSGNGGGFIEPGYSGSPVWNHDQHAYIGLTVSIETAQNVFVAYSISMESIQSFVGELSIEKRRLFRGVDFTWTLASVFLFIMMVAHNHAIQSETVPGIIGVWAPNGELAEFWGMMFFTFLGPVVLGLLYLHTSSLKLHRWWQKVPVLFGRKKVSSVGNTKIQAGLSLLFLVIVPAYFQGHFIKEFHDSEGVVAVYPESLGYTEQEYKIEFGCEPATDQRPNSKGIPVCPTSTAMPAAVFSSGP